MSTAVVVLALAAGNIGFSRKRFAAFLVEQQQTRVELIYEVVSAAPDTDTHTHRAICAVTFPCPSFCSAFFETVMGQIAPDALLQFLSTPLSSILCRRSGRGSLVLRVNPTAGGAARCAHSTLPVEVVATDEHQV